MKRIHGTKSRKIEAVRLRLPAPQRIEAVCPETGPLGEEWTRIFILPDFGGDGLPVIFPFAVPVVMEAIALEAGWEFSAAAALGRCFSSLQQGDILPLLPIVFVSVKMRCRASQHQNVWGYLNVSLPLDAVVPDTHRQEKGSTVVFLSGHAVHSPWSAKTVGRKIREARRVRLCAAPGPTSAGWTALLPVDQDGVRGQVRGEEMVPC